MDFTLSNETKRLMLTKHLEQIQIEAYQHEMNRLVAVQVGDEKKEAEAVAAITTLETESNVYVAEIASLDNPLTGSENAEILTADPSTPNSDPSVDVPTLGFQDVYGTQGAISSQENDVAQVDTVAGID